MKDRTFKIREGRKWTSAIVLAVLSLLCIPATAEMAFTPSVPQTLAKGDTFTISGTGAHNGSVTVWVIGRDYFDRITTVPDTNGTFALTLTPETTTRFSSGQYAFVIQDPGMNGNAEIDYRFDGAGNISLLNGRAVLADIGPKQDIRADAEPIVRILLTGATRPGVDDILTPHYFFIEEPSVHFDQKSRANPDGQLPDVTVGERITLSGTTNMGVENLLHADLRNLKTNTLISSRTIPVIAEGRMNRWSFELETTGLSPGEYSVTVGWMKSNTTGTGTTLVTLHEKPDSGKILFPVMIGGGLPQCCPVFCQPEEPVDPLRDHTGMPVRRP